MKSNDAFVAQCSPVLIQQLVRPINGSASNKMYVSGEPGELSNAVPSEHFFSNHRGEGPEFLIFYLLRT